MTLSSLMEPYQLEKTPGVSLEKRTSVLGLVQGLGPPDLCYLISERPAKGLKKLFLSSKQEARFHYILGNQTSSVSQMATYFHKYVGTKHWPLCNGFYCLFDLFSRHDVRVEVNVPGGITTFSINSYRRKIDVTELQLKGAHVSSVLRYFYAQNITPSVCICPFRGIQDLKLFVEAASVFRHQIGMVVGDLNDTVKYSEHLLFHSLSKYLVKRRMFEVHRVYFEKLTQSDPLMLGLLTSVSTHGDPLLQERIEKQLKQTPSLQLEFALGTLLLNGNQLDQAERMLKGLIEKHSVQFVYWGKLIETLLLNENFDEALICMNCAPVTNATADPLTQYSHCDELVVSRGVTDAKWIPDIWQKPTFFDYKPTTRASKQSLEPNEAGIQANLKNLPSAYYTSQKKNLYKLLVGIWRVNNWDYLMDRRQSLFANIEHSFQIEETRMLDSTQTLNKTNDSFLIERYHANDCSISIEPLELGRANLDIEVPNAISCPSAHLLLQEFEETSSFSFAEAIRDSNRLEGPVFSELVESLYKDLEALIFWHKESTETDGLNRTMIKNKKLSGAIWIMRGHLAERLLKPKLAERAYRYSNEKGFSLFSWYRLMKVYCKTCNPRAALVCIIEVIKELRAMDIEFNEALPEWIEEVLCKLCSGCGLRQLEATALELKCKRFPCIVNTLAKLQQWKVDGTSDDDD